MLEKIRSFLLHPLRTILNKVLNERQKEKIASLFAPVTKRVDKAADYIAQHIVKKMFKDEEKIEIIVREAETRIIWYRIQWILILVGLVVVLIFRLCGKEI